MTDPKDPALMQAALVLIGNNCAREDEDGPIADALDYGDIEWIVYAGLGLIPLRDPALKARLDRIHAQILAGGSP